MRNGLKSKEEILFFCECYLEKLKQGSNWKDSLLSNLEEFSELEYERLLQIIESDNNWSKGINELIKFSESNYSHFMFEELLLIEKFNSNPIIVVEDIIFEIRFNPVN